MNNNMTHYIIVPKQNVNDDTVKLIKWFVKEGDLVETGDVVAEIDTSKAAIEIESEYSGFIGNMVNEMTEIDVGSRLASITSKDLRAIDEKPQELSNKDNKVIIDSALQSECNYTVTKKARELMEKHNISFDEVKHNGIIKSSHINSYLNAQGFTENDTDNISDAEYIEKGILYEISSSSKGRGKSSLWLIINYLIKTWFLTNIARWTPYRVIIGLHRLRGVNIGKDCFIAPTSIIETAYPEGITIGNDVRIADYAVIMTHIKPPHYQIKHKISNVVRSKIEIHNYAFIGLGAIILPGVTIGESAIVMSGSVVLDDVLPYTMVAGNPAKLVKNLKKK